MTDQEALTYADANQIPQPALAGIEEAAAPNDQDAIVEQLQMAAPAVIPAVTEEATKTPKPKATRKRKSTAAEGAEEGDTSAVKTTPASPEKKRKRQSKAAEPASEEPKKSARKKKST
jgi:hypothetical protein